VPWSAGAFDRLMAAYVDILQEHRDMFEIVGAI